MDAPTSGAAAPATEQTFTEEDEVLMQVLWLLLAEESPLHVDFKDPGVAACLQSLGGEIGDRPRDAAAALKKRFEAAASTRTSDSPGDDNGTYMFIPKVLCL